MGKLNIISDDTILNALHKANLPTHHIFREAARVGAIMQAVYDQLPPVDVSNLDPQWTDFADSQWLGG